MRLVSLLLMLGDDESEFFSKQATKLSFYDVKYRDQGNRPNGTIRCIDSLECKRHETRLNSPDVVLEDFSETTRVTQWNADSEGHARSARCHR